jgi:hypothetical protein
VKVLDQLAIELHDARLEVRDQVQVRIARAEVVDDEVHACAPAHLPENVRAEREVRHRRGLGDL